MNNMKKHVIKLVRDVVKEHASTEIPVFDEICFGLGLDVKEGPLPPGTDGTHEGSTISIPRSKMKSVSDLRNFTKSPII